MVTVIGGVAAVTVLFTHTFPNVTVPGVPALVSTTCPSTTLISTAPTTASGFIFFECATPPSPTFAAFTTGTAAVAVIPGGSMPNGYADLYAVPTTTPASIIKCGAATGSVVILPSNPTPSTTGLTITASSGTGLAAGSAYIYCADYINTSTSSLTLTTFTVTWNQ